jgi:integrase
MPLKEARAKAAVWYPLLVAGEDPTAPPKPALTFGELARQWREAILVPGGRLAEATIRRKTIILNKWIMPALADFPAAELRRTVLLEKLLRPLEAQRLFETALRAKEIVGAIYNWAGLEDDRMIDPTAGLKNAMQRPAVKNHAGLTDPARLGELLRAVEGYSGRLIRLALKLLALLFPRPGELRLARWSEFDFEKAVWEIPAGRTKMRKLHRIPLCPQALAVLSELRTLTGGAGPNGFLFPNFRHSQRPISDNSLNAGLRAMGYGPEAHVAHGFRSTASTLLREVFNFDDRWVEASLAHGKPDTTQASYDRATFFEPRKKMMAVWADYLDDLRAGREKEEIQ